MDFDPYDPLGNPEQLLACFPVGVGPPARQKLLGLFRGLRTSFNGAETLHFRNQPLALSEYARNALPLAWLPRMRGSVRERFRLDHGTAGKIRWA